MYVLMVFLEIITQEFVNLIVRLSLILGLMKLPICASLPAQKDFLHITILPNVEEIVWEDYILIHQQELV